MWKDVLSYVIGALILAGITAVLVFGRKLVQVPRQMIIITASLFRLLRSNKLQGTALQKLAMAIKTGCTNGESDAAVEAVQFDQKKTDEFFKRIALTPQEKLEDLLEEDE